jgi:[ribosomal protein S5]-alanine N-acetyltransferase
MDQLQVRLRPFTEPDLELFDRFAADPALSEPFEWAGFTPPGGYRKRWERDGLLGSSPYCLAVATVDDNAVIGWVDWRETARPGPGAWEIGVLIVPEMRGRGAGTWAQRRLVEYLFSTTTAFRVWAATEVENVAEQRALERSGLIREGRLRGTHFRDGRWRDSFIYGIIRDDISGSSPKVPGALTAAALAGEGLLRPTERS